MAKETQLETSITKTTFKEILNYYAPDVFKDPTFGELTCYRDSNNQYWFIGSEVCFKLGYSNPWDALGRHVPPQYQLRLGKREAKIERHGGDEHIILINELGLYCLAIKSRMPGALRFQEWVYQAIQNIRQYGSYMDPKLIEVIQFDPAQLYRIAEAERLKNMKLMEQIYLQQSQYNLLFEKWQADEKYHKNFIDPDHLFTSTEIAKAFGLSAQALNALLHRWGIIYFINGTFAVYQSLSMFNYTQTKNVRLPNGVIAPQTCWTEWGRHFIHDMLDQHGFVIGDNQHNQETAKLQLDDSMLEDKDIKD